MTGTRRALGGRGPMNPVLARELRVRLRGGRTWILLTAYLLLLGVICYLVYASETRAPSGFDQFGGASPTQFATVGRSIFEWLVFFMLLLVLFLVPGLSSGAIAGERERQTLVPLQVTLLRPWQVVVGKLGASFAFIALLVVATAPLLSVAYLIGGVTFAAVLRGLAIVLFTGLALTCLTLCCSAVFRRVQAATVAAYAVMLALTLGTFVVFTAAGILDSTRGDDPSDPPSFLLAANPFFTAADVLGDADAAQLLSSGPSPFRPLAEVILRSEVGVSDGIVGVPFEGDGFGPGGFGPGLGTDEQGRPIIGFDRFGQPIVDTGERWPFWATSVITLYVLAVAAAWFTVRRLRAPARSER